VTTATVLRLLDAPPGLDDEQLLRRARSARHKLAATLLSLWEAEGRDLTQAQIAELAASRERVAAYGRIWGELRRCAPDAVLLKGLAVAALYPPGVLRSAGDLDVVCPGYADFWACANQLADGGWELEAFTVGPARPGDSVPHHLFAEFRKASGISPAGDPADPMAPSGPEPFAVGLVTAEIVTDLRAPARELTRPARSALATSAVALVAERWERPFRSRDLLDLVLLLRGLDAAGAEQLRADLGRAGLWPEWREAVSRIRGLGWRPAVTLPGTRAAAVRERALRALRAVRRESHPVRGLARLARTGIEAEDGRLADFASDLLERWPGPLRVLDLGLPLFGVPLDGPASADFGLERRGRHLLARTPLGPFLLVAGAARQEWLDEVGAGSGARSNTAV
jgi:hypothetical protein